MRSILCRPGSKAPERGPRRLPRRRGGRWPDAHGAWPQVRGPHASAGPLGQRPTPALNRRNWAGDVPRGTSKHARDRARRSPKQAVRPQRRSPRAPKGQNRRAQHRRVARLSPPPNGTGHWEGRKSADPLGARTRCHPILPTAPPRPPCHDEGPHQVPAAISSGRDQICQNSAKPPTWLPRST
jgi:hypothetical protein